MKVVKLFVLFFLLVVSACQQSKNGTGGGVPLTQLPVTSEIASQDLPREVKISTEDLPSNVSGDFYYVRIKEIQRDNLPIQSHSQLRTRRPFYIFQNKLYGEPQFFLNIRQYKDQFNLKNIPRETDAKKISNALFIEHEIMFEGGRQGGFIHYYLFTELPSRIEISKNLSGNELDLDTMPQSELRYLPVNLEFSVHESGALEVKLTHTENGIVQTTLQTTSEYQYKKENLKVSRSIFPTIPIELPENPDPNTFSIRKVTWENIELSSTLQIKTIGKFNEISFY